MTIPGRCHFDADGWLQGPISITYYTSPNHYTSGFAEQARGLVQHTEDGFTAGTVATFLSAASEVSAFFGVSETGAAQQFLPLGQGFQAWAQGAGNQAWRSCECEDKTQTGQPMTPPQIAAFAQILEACSAYDGFPLQITDDPVNGTGLITHGDGGVAWGDHPDCPGDVRKAQRPELVALATQIRSGVTPPPPSPPPAKEPEMILVSVNEAEVPKGTDWPGVFLLDASGLHHVTSPPDVAAYQKAGVPGPVTISWGEYQARLAAPAAGLRRGRARQ